MSKTSSERFALRLSGRIHSTAVISPGAEIGRDVEIGPFCVVEPDAIVEDGCKLESHAVVKSGTRLGPHNHVCEGAVLGGLPQHVHVPDRPGKVVIGAGNTIRENVTVHRALTRTRPPWSATTTC